MVVVLCDATHVVCLRSLTNTEAGAELILPSRLLDMDEFGRLTFPQDKGAIRKAAIAFWRGFMGPPPKPINIAINSRLQKAVRVGESFVLMGVSQGCHRLVSRLVDAARGTRAGRSRTRSETRGRRPVARFHIVS